MSRDSGYYLYMCGVSSVVYLTKEEYTMRRFKVRCLECGSVATYIGMYFRQALAKYSRCSHCGWVPEENIQIDHPANEENFVRQVLSEGETLE